MADQFDQEKVMEIDIELFRATLMATFSATLGTNNLLIQVTDVKSVLRKAKPLGHKVTKSIP